MVTGIPVRSLSDPGSLTTAEGLIWLGQRLDPESTLYNMALAVEVSGALDVASLQAALRAVGRHVGNTYSRATDLFDITRPP